MKIETNGRRGILYTDAVAVRRKNGKVTVLELVDGNIVAIFKRVIANKIRKKDLESNQRLITRVGINVLITQITFSKESLNDLIIALDGMSELEKQ